MNTCPRLQRRAIAGSPLPNLDPLLDRLYRARGIHDPGQLEYRLAAMLPPTQLHSMSRACGRLADAASRQERIVIVGDFDADGATGVAVAMRAMQAFGIEWVDYRVPDRFEYGYGLSPALVASIAKDHPQLLVTVDNGISSVEGVAAANRLGIDVIVTDHHLPGDTLPEAVAIVNPNQPECRFASKAIAGVGVMFYLMAALRAELKSRGWFKEKPLPSMAPLLELVALGTVADLVPLDHNNRILVDQGLRRIRQRGNPGIEALMNIAGRDIERATASDLAFAVAPRLNAAGRLEDMRIGIECLLADDPDTAMELALRLDEINKDRRSLQSEMEAQAAVAVDQALASLGVEKLPHAVVLFQPDWHQGVVGLLASRVKERLIRPTIVFAPEHEGADVLKGSGRSVRGIHLRDVLAEVDTAHPGMIDRFGGHAMAAGLSLHRQHLAPFSKAVDRAVRRVSEPSQFEAVLVTDGPLDAEQMRIEIAAQLAAAGPWGQAFPEPQFDNAFEVMEQRVVGDGHLKLRLRPEGSRRIFDGIWFRAPVAELSGLVHLVYGLDINVYQGVARLQLLIRGQVEA